MNRFLPTYEDCMEICDKAKISVRRVDSDDPEEMFVFAPNTHEVAGKIITTFNYGLFLNHDICVNPVEDNQDLEAFELRGITFIPTENGYERVLMLPKFFNLNQYGAVMYHELKDIPVKRVQVKADGSMLSFIRIGDQLYSRTKNSFMTTQSKLADQFILDNPGYSGFLHECFDTGVVPIFEICSPLNMIVLYYEKTSLPLLHLRDLETGEFLDIYNSNLVRKYGIETVESLEIEPLSHWRDLASETTNMEGWVITLEDNTMVKIKTEWYLDLHHLTTEVAGRENLIIQSIFENRIDDLLARMDKNSPRVPYIEEITEVVLGEVFRQVERALVIKETFDGNRKEFFETHRSDPLCAVYMKSLPFDDRHTGEQVRVSREDLEEFVMKKISKQTKKLNWARDYLSSLGVNVNRFVSGVFTSNGGEEDG